jgi:hypothetical protein
LAKSKKVPAVEKANVFQHVGPLVPQDAAAQDAYPVLLDLLLPRYRDGVLVRQSSSLRLRQHGSVWAVTIACPTECLECTVLAESLCDVLAAVEKVLSSGRAVWVPGYSRAKKVLPTIDGVI